MASYIIATKSPEDAQKARRFYEKHGIPCWITMNKSTYVLFTIDEATACVARHLKYLPIRPYRHRDRKRHR